LRTVKTHDRTSALAAHAGAASPMPSSSAAVTASAVSPADMGQPLTRLHRRRRPGVLAAAVAPRAGRTSRLSSTPIGTGTTRRCQPWSWTWADRPGISVRGGLWPSSSGSAATATTS